MVQMIRALDTVLLRPCETKLAASADSTGKPDANETSNLDVLVAILAQRDDASYPFMSADVWEFDLGDGVAVGA